MTRGRLPCSSHTSYFPAACNPRSLKRKPGTLGCICFEVFIGEPRSIDLTCLPSKWIRRACTLACSRTGRLKNCWPSGHGRGRKCGGDWTSLPTETLCNPSSSRSPRSLSRRAFFPTFPFASGSRRNQPVRHLRTRRLPRPRPIVLIIFHDYGRQPSALRESALGSLPGPSRSVRSWWEPIWGASFGGRRWKGGTTRLSGSMNRFVEIRETRPCSTHRPIRKLRVTRRLHGELRLVSKTNHRGTVSTEISQRR